MRTVLGNSGRRVARIVGALVLLAASLPACATAAPVAPNALANPGFESPYLTIVADPSCPNIAGAVAEGWQDNTCWFGTGAEIVYAQDISVKHGGASAQRIQLNAGRWQLAQWVPFHAGRIYTASVWLRSAAPLRVSLVLRKLAEPYTAYTVRNFTVTPAWTRVALSGAVETTDGAYILTGLEPGTLWIDDADLTSAPAAAPDLPTAAVPRSYVGVHYHRVDTPWPAVEQAIGALRLWDAEGCQWAEVNTAAGSYDWSALDARVNAARANGAQIVMNLGRTPRWASARPDEYSPYGPGQAAEPADDQHWRDWVMAVGTRYRGQITYWEIWNEPNISDFYSGSAARLVDLARQAHAILKDIDPSNHLLAPSATGDLGWLGDYLALGGGDYADIIGYHFYLLPGDDAPELLYQAMIPNTRLLLAAYGQQHKPLWDTEAGWLALEGSNPLLPDETAVGFMGRRHVLAWAQGVGRMFFYAWDNHGVMSVETTGADNTTLTPAGVAYREIARWLTGSVMTSLASDGAGTWVAELRRPDASKGYIVWNPGYTSATSLVFQIPASWRVVAWRDLSGAGGPLAARSSAPASNAVAIAVDGRPILLEQAPGVARSWLPLIYVPGFDQRLLCCQMHIGPAP